MKPAARDAAVIARRGDVVLCPSCEEPVAVVLEDIRERQIVDGDMLRAPDGSAFRDDSKLRCGCGQRWLATFLKGLCPIREEAEE